MAQDRWQRLRARSMAIQAQDVFETARWGHRDDEGRLIPPTPADQRRADQLKSILGTGSRPGRPPGARASRRSKYPAVEALVPWYRKFVLAHPGIRIDSRVAKS